MAYFIITCITFEDVRVFKSIFSSYSGAWQNAEGRKVGLCVSSL